MKISIIIPVYNVEKYLRRCLDSAVNQTYRDIEVIVVDDASTDQSKDIIREYELQYPDLIKAVYLSKNICNGGARNKGLELATGEYILYLDSDDYIDLTMCEKMLSEALRSNSDLVYCDAYRNFDNKNKMSWVSYQYEEQMGDMDDVKYQLQLLNYGYIWAKLIKTKLLIDNHITFPENKKYEDFYFMPLVILSAQKTSYLKEPLYYYTIREQSIMTTRNIDHHKDIVYTGELLYNELIKRGFEQYADGMKAIAYYKAVKMIIDKNDEPDVEYIYNLIKEIEKFDRTSDLQLQIMHDPIEIEIVRTAKKSKDELAKKIQEGYFTDGNANYNHYYQTYKDCIEKLLRKHENKQVAIWGYGKKGKSFLDIVHKIGIEIPYIIDNNVLLQGTVLDTGEKIVSFSEVSQVVDLIIVINRNYFSANESEVKNLNPDIMLCNLEGEIMLNECNKERKI